VIKDKSLALTLTYCDGDAGQQQQIVHITEKSALNKACISRRPNAEKPLSGED
jgi:hypothetical protein